MKVQVSNFWNGENWLFVGVMWLGGTLNSKLGKMCDHHLLVAGSLNVYSLQFALAVYNFLLRRICATFWVHSFYEVLSYESNPKAEQDFNAYMVFEENQKSQVRSLHIWSEEWLQCSCFFLNKTLCTCGKNAMFQIAY